MKRLVTQGASSASPAAMTRTASNRRSAVTSLSRKRLRAGAKRVVHVPVQIERRQHEDARPIGSFSSRATRPAKCTSPAKASVISPEAATGWRCLTTALARSIAASAACRAGELAEQAALSTIKALAVTMSSRWVYHGP
jgi:hypothetical protein